MVKGGIFGSNTGGEQVLWGFKFVAPTIASVGHASRLRPSGPGNDV